MKKMNKGKKKLTVAVPHPLDSVVDWKKCCICQIGGGKTVCPANNPVVSLRNKGYATLASNFLLLSNHNHVLPSGMQINSLKGEGDIEQTFIQKKAQWHKACNLKYVSPKFDLLLSSLSKASEEESCFELQEGSQAYISQQRGENNSARATRSTAPLVNVKEDVRFICIEPGNKKNSLHLCATKTIYDKVKHSAEVLGDTRLLAILADGDLVAQEAKYHLKCLARLYKRSSRNVKDEQQDTVMCKSLAFADLIIYIHDELEQSERKAIFQMSKLNKQYTSRLAQLLGVAVESMIPEHPTRLREKILAHIPELKEHLSGKEYVLMVDKANILTDAIADDEDDDALAINRVIKKLRKSISGLCVSFSGTFDINCEKNSIPPALLAIVNMLLYGSAVHTDCGATKPALTIGQLILFNMHEKQPKSNVVRNRKHLEPPLPLYMALSTYGRSRDKRQIDEMHNLGLSVSHNRIMEVTSHLCRMAVAQAQTDGVVCPSQLKKNLFTVSALDNIDHKPTSNTSEGEFHGTGISIFQLPLQDNPVPRSFEIKYEEIALAGNRSVPRLPDSYAVVTDCMLREAKPQVPSCSFETSDQMCPKGNFACCVYNIRLHTTPIFFRFHSKTVGKGRAMAYAFSQPSFRPDPR